MKKKHSLYFIVCLSHTPALLQVSDGSVTNVVPVHRTGEADGQQAPIGRVQGHLQRWPDCGDSYDAPATGDHAPVL